MSAPSTDKAGVQQVYRTLIKNGYTVEVQDGDGNRFKDLKTEAEVIANVMSCDDGYFIAYHTGQRIGFIWFVFGNEPYEVIADHSVSLSHVLDPLTDSWWR